MREAGIWLPGKGCFVKRSTSWRETEEKSPFRCAGVRTNVEFPVEMLRVCVPWYVPKKNSLSFTMGPPRLPPNWFRFSLSEEDAKKLRAFIAPLRRNSNIVPCS